MNLLKFEPLLKQTIWGGTRIAAFKKIDAESNDIGESWELSGVPGNETCVKEGPLKGRSLNDLVSEYKGELVGRENYERFGNEFPILVKFIDAHQDLSIQVHPSDETAHKQGKERGKTEMWYCLGADEKKVSGVRKPKIYCGLEQRLTPAEYEQMVANGTITQAIASYEVNEGDVFFIPAGRIHAIGAGCFVVEIQQSSDITYRIFDYNRRDKNGNLRQLHTKEAAESIDFSVLPNYRMDYVPQKDLPQQLVSCPYFTTAVYDITEPMLLDYSELDSFVVLVGVKGKGTLVADGQATSLNAGETILLPATTQEVRVEGEVAFLETYV